MPQAEVNGAQLFYALSGRRNGPVVVLSNSLGTMLEMINNMPDSALEATERQFISLPDTLHAARCSPAVGSPELPE